MLTPDEVIATTAELWKRHAAEISEHDRVYGYVRGERGVPDVPEGSGDELSDLAKMSVKNILGLVEDAFTQGLSVEGYRSPSEATDAPVWALWQRFRMDARQSEVHRSAVRYGTGYAIGLRDEARLRSPRQLIAVYADPHADLWPVYALEHWIDNSGPKPVRRGALYDSTHIYRVSLGQVGVTITAEDGSKVVTGTPHVEFDPADAVEHGADVCPVVRFVNDRDAEEVVRGEIAPNIASQRAINAVNFDRLVVSRFGAFPQKYAIGYSPGSSAELARVSAARLMAFDDLDVKVGDFAQASVDPYNKILEEMLSHVAMTSQIPVAAVTGQIANLSAEALVMAEAPYQRKLAAKRESFGESWEQWLWLVGSLNGVDVPTDAETVWRTTESRAFSAVVDGITKLVASGVPITELLVDVPGWGQQRVDSARRAIAETLAPSSGIPDAATPGAIDAGIRDMADALGVLIRAGVDPEDAAARVGLPGVVFTGAVPVSLRLPDSASSALEDR